MRGEIDPTPRSLRDRLGEWLLIEYVTSPNLLDPEDLRRTVTDKTQAHTELLCLDQIGAYGIVGRRVAEGSPRSISWGELLAIQDVVPVETGVVVQSEPAVSVLPGTDPERGVGEMMRNPTDRKLERRAREILDDEIRKRKPNSRRLRGASTLKTPRAHRWG